MSLDTAVPQTINRQQTTRNCTTDRIDLGEGSATSSGTERHDGWQLLATASLGRLLTDAELDIVDRTPADRVLDMLFPDLSDAARHEALSALG